MDEWMIEREMIEVRTMQRDYHLHLHLHLNLHLHLIIAYLVDPRQSAVCDAVHEYAVVRRYLTYRNSARVCLRRIRCADIFDALITRANERDV